MKSRLFISGVFSAFLIVSACYSKPTAVKPCDADLAKEKNQVACHDWAFHNFERDPKTSLPELAMLCTSHKLARACSNYAYYFENAKPDQKPDLKTASQYYQMGCKLGDGIACNNLANVLFLGEPTEKDKRGGVLALQRGCELGYAPSCYRVAIITTRGILLKNDPAEVAALMTRGCDLGDAVSCHDLGYLYMDGTGVTRDQGRALELFKTSCAKDLARGCGTLGSMYLMGGAEKIDYEKARELLEKACAGDDAPSCSNLGYLIETGKGTSPNPEAAAQYYDKACSSGDALGCGNLGVLLAEGRGVPQDDKAALPHLEKGCADQAADSCANLALFHERGRAGLPVSKTTANFYREKACGLGDEASCSALARGFTSLCGKQETQVLSCMTGEQRMLSICGVQSASQHVLLSYRFGTAQHQGLRFEGPMKFVSDKWGNGEKYVLSFQNGGSRYEVVETVSKMSEPAVRSVQIHVSQDAKSTKLECRVPLMGSLASDLIRKAENVGP